MKKFWKFLPLVTVFIWSCSGESGNESGDSTGDTTSDTDVALSGSAFEQFVAYVNDQNRELANLDSVFSKFESLKVDFSDEEKDSAFFVVKEFMEEFELTEEDYTQEGQKKLEKKYGKAGFEIWWEEGDPYLVPDLKFLEKKFKGSLSAELDDYLDVLNKIGTEITVDGGLIITWDELQDMLIDCEEYLAENSDSKYASPVLDQYMQLLYYVMWGIDNSPIIDTWTDETNYQLEEEVAQVYQKLIKDTKHKTGKILADHLTWLESVNFDIYGDGESRVMSREEACMYLGIEVK